jgi:beta-mannosidase
MTVGPWSMSLSYGRNAADSADPEPIHLETYTYRLKDVRIDTDLIGPDYTRATLKGTLDVAPASPSPTEDYSLKVVLRSKEGKMVKEAKLVAGKDPLNWELEKGMVEGWYPVGYGKQPLYELEITLLDKVCL